MPFFNEKEEKKVIEIINKMCDFLRIDYAELILISPFLSVFLYILVGAFIEMVRYFMSVKWNHSRKRRAIINAGKHIGKQIRMVILRPLRFLIRILRTVERWLQ